MQQRKRDHSNSLGSRSSLRKTHKAEGRRLVRKNGKSDVVILESAEKVYTNKGRSLVHILMDAKWKWTLSVLIMTFIFTWIFFALLWMAIGIANGDQEEPMTEKCLLGVGNFSGYLLFSIETQTSIGYGSRSVTQNCFGAVVLVCFQILVGMGLGGSIVSIVYGKMISPRTQHSNRCFTRNAVVCQRDGELCLILRMRDPNEKYAVQTNIKAYLIKMRGGEFLLKSLKLEPVGMVIWPTEVVHKITETSPFWNLSAQDLVTKRFEMIVVMEGTSLSTNQSSRTVTSYLSNEILWGNVFRSCVKFDMTRKSYRVSHKRFNSTVEVPTPLCSAQKLFQVYNEILNYQSDSVVTPSSPEEVSQCTSVSPESGIVVSPISDRVEDFQTEDDNSSQFSSVDSSEDEAKYSRFQIRRKSSIIVNSLLDSLQKYVYTDLRRNTIVPSYNSPMETSL